MKKYTSQLLAVLLILYVFTTGCLKDDDFDNGAIQSVHNNGDLVKPIEIKLTAANASNFFVLAVDNSDNDTTVDLVPINLATSDPAPQDLHVTVSLDDALVDAYNAENGTNGSQ